MCKCSKGEVELTMCGRSGNAGCMTAEQSKYGCSLIVIHERGTLSSISWLARVWKQLSLQLVLECWRKLRLNVRFPAGTFSLVTPRRYLPCLSVKFQWPQILLRFNKLSIITLLFASRVPMWGQSMSTQFVAVTAGGSGIRFKWRRDKRNHR